MTDQLQHIVAVEPRSGHRLWCKFNDGYQGVADYSDLAETPYCRKWLEPGFFEAVVVDGGSLRWDDMIDVSADHVRARLLGLPKEATLEEIWSHVGEFREYPDIREAETMPGYAVHCIFGDGFEGRADFSAWADNPKFGKWKTTEGYFASMRNRGWGLQWGEWDDIWNDCVYENVLAGVRT